MARSIGDLTDIDNVHERIEVARMLTKLADDVRMRRVRSLSISKHRDVDPVTDWPMGVPPILSAWDVEIQVDQPEKH